jgi:glycerol-3-phosphate acyltransferase PlsY
LYKLFRISSVGSLVGVLVAVVICARTADRDALYGLLAVSFVILVRHEGNIRRLLNRQEK